MKCKIFSGSIFYTFSPPPPSVFRLRVTTPPPPSVFRLRVTPPSVCVSPPPLRLCFASGSPPPPPSAFRLRVTTPPPQVPWPAQSLCLLCIQHALVLRGCGLLTHEICTSSPTPAPATKSHFKGNPCGKTTHHTRSLGQATHKPTNRHQSAKTNSNDNNHKRIQQKPQQTTNKNINQNKRRSNKPSNVLK